MMREKSESVQREEEGGVETGRERERERERGGREGDGSSPCLLSRSSSMSAHRPSPDG